MGEDWLIPRYSFDKNAKLATEVCNWKHYKEELTNLRFNDDIEAVISNIHADDELLRLPLSKHSSFGLTKSRLKTCVIY